MTTPSSTYATRQTALAEAVRWASEQDAASAADVVKAAGEFDAFVAGAPVVRERRTLAELYDNVQWDDPQWRSDFLTGIVDSVVGGLRSPRLLKIIGNVAELSGFDRALVKGVRDLEVTSINRSDGPSTSAAPVTIDRNWKLDQAIFEIAPRLMPEFKAAFHEDEIRMKTPEQLDEFVLTLIVDARKTLDDWIIGAVRGLLQSANHTLDPEAWDFLDDDFAPVVPFRFEFVCFDGWRAKEWVEEGGEWWHFWIKGKFGAAVFKPVGPDGMFSGIAGPVPEPEQTAQPGDEAPGG